MNTQLVNQLNGGLCRFLWFGPEQVIAYKYRRALCVVTKSPMEPHSTRSRKSKFKLNDMSSPQLTRDAEIIPRSKTASYLGVVQRQSTRLRFVSNPGHTT
jgi:hypothetical protein